MKQLILFLPTFLYIMVFGQSMKKNNPNDFIPQGHKLFERVNGDLNKDGVEDCILIVKATDKSNIVMVEGQGEVDRNPRGIIILFNKNGKYELVLNNYNCFSSENEDGGVYFPPELSFSIKKGNLYISYGHGRYGFWEYTFRFKTTDFELIGYDNSDNSGPVVNSQTSINFLSKKKQTKVNTNENAVGGDEVFKTTWKNITVSKLLKLSAISNFDSLDLSGY